MNNDMLMKQRRKCIDMTVNRILRNMTVTTSDEWYSSEHALMHDGNMTLYINWNVSWKCLLGSVKNLASRRTWWWSVCGKDYRTHLVKSWFERYTAKLFKRTNIFLIWDPMVWICDDVDKSFVFVFLIGVNGLTIDGRSYEYQVHIELSC
jgi:hypothetical protein